MKRITSIALFSLMSLALSIPVLAQDVQPIDSQVAAVVATNLTPGAKMQALTPLAQVAGANRTAEKADYAKMMPKKDAIDMAAAAINKYAPSVSTAVANLNIELDAHASNVAAQDAATEQHNANRCTAPSDNPGVCAAYNNEADRLNTNANRLTQEASQLNQRRDALLTEKATLAEMQKNLSSDLLEYTAWQKSYNANMQQNEANITLLLNTYKQLQQQLDDCKAAIKNGTNENMAERCGAPFDGNTIHDGKTNRGTGTNEFGKGGNPVIEQEPHN